MAEAVETLDHQTMGRALAEGTAVCLSRTITRFVHYAGGWWGLAPFAWVKLTDPEVCAGLDALAVKLADADSAVQRSAEHHSPLSRMTREDSR